MSTPFMCRPMGGSQDIRAGHAHPSRFAIFFTGSAYIVSPRARATAGIEVSPPSQAKVFLADGGPRKYPIRHTPDKAYSIPNRWSTTRNVSL